MPFAEYIPNRSFWRIFSKEVDLVSGDFVAGPAPGVFHVPAAGQQIRAGLAICFEVAYDDIMRDAVQTGANVLVVQTNNATFGYTAESPQQLAISRLRAMEFGRSVVHVSTVGSERPDHPRRNRPPGDVVVHTGGRSRGHLAGRHDAWRPAGRGPGVGRRRACCDARSWASGSTRVAADAQGQRHDEGRG